MWLNSGIQGVAWDCVPFDHRSVLFFQFEFINCFMSLFYIAFIYQDMQMLRTVSSPEPASWHHLSTPADRGLIVSVPTLCTSIYVVVYLALSVFLILAADTGHIADSSTDHKSAAGSGFALCSVQTTQEDNNQAVCQRRQQPGERSHWEPETTGRYRGHQDTVPSQ